MDNKKLMDITVSELIDIFKDSIFSIFDDLLKHRFEPLTFTKNYRLHSLGILLIIFAIILSIFSVLFDGNNSQSIHYYHHYK